MAAREEVRYRRSPHVVGYWQQGELLLRNYATDVTSSIAGVPLTLTLLDFFDDWRPASDLFDALGQFTRASLRQALGRLVRHTLLQRSDRAPDTTERALEAWSGWNPAAGFFHTATRNHAYGDGDPEPWARARALRGPPPDPIKRYPRAASVTLPAPRRDGEFPQTLLERRTWRSFEDAPLELADLATLLGLTWAIQHDTRLSDDQRVILKTSPSGGARHPLEVYVLALRVTGLRRGLYHYRPDTHRLELVRAGATARQVQRYLPTGDWCAAAGAITFITSVFPRKQWKYSYPRVYRSIFIEVGHFAQTFCLAATWLGLAPFALAALADDQIEKDLAIDGVTEAVLYAAGVGRRPPGVRWVSRTGRSLDHLLGGSLGPGSK